MPDFSAKDVQRLRQVSGAGMMDAKRALTECDGDFEAATRWLREKGLGKAGERSGRENVQGAVAVATSANAAALVELKCETDFVAKSPDFVELAEDLARQVAKEGEQATAGRADAIDDLRIKLKENIELGQVVRFEAAEGHVIDTYLHVQSGRGVNGVLVELANGTAELAHDIAVHIAFGRPRYVSRDEVPAEEIEQERASLEAETRNEGKPDAAVPKIVEGKLAGWYKRVPGGVLSEQPYAKDDKRTVQQVLGDAQVVRFAQVVIGA
jgi:elongation factor Ts